MPNTKNNSNITPCKTLTASQHHDIAKYSQHRNIMTLPNTHRADASGHCQVLLKAIAAHAMRKNGGA
eukprot:57403-Pelagomonas_calceolata.AAC.6